MARNVAAQFPPDLELQYIRQKTMKIIPSILSGLWKKSEKTSFQKVSFHDIKDMTGSSDPFPQINLLLGQPQN